MPICLIAQPIHRAAIEHLRAAGLEVRLGTGNDAENMARGLAGVDAAIVREGLTAEQIDLSPRLAVIANHGTGTDQIDVAHAHARGIAVTYTPDANVRAVAEHAVMLMLAVARQATAAHAATRQGNWRFKYERSMQSLHGKTLGIVGFGRTGQLVAGIASRGLGMRVLVWSPRADPAEVAAQGAQAAASFEALLAEADVVSLHRPLRPDTRHTLNAATLAQMKTSAIVVNTSRGGLVDEDALFAALRAGRLFGAGLDVFATEPMPVSSPLATLDNVVLTPHTAGSTEEALLATAMQSATQVLDVLAGRQPVNMLDPSVWSRRRVIS